MKKEECIYFQNLVRKTCWVDDTFQTEVFVEILASSRHFITSGQNLYWYNSEKGFFQNITKELPHHSLRKYIPNELQYKVSVRHLKVVAVDLMDQPSIYSELKSNPMCVNFLNGVVDIKTGNLGSHSPDYMFDYVLNCEYKDYASLNSAPQFSKYLLKSFGVKNIEADEIKLLMETIGYILSDFTKAKKMFIFFGPSNSGKSTLLHVIEEIIGEENVSSISLEDMNHQFRCRDIVKSRLNMLHEVTTKPISKVDVLKRIVGHEKIEVESKGVQPWSAKAKAKLLMAVNALPRFAAGEANNSLINRMIILKWYDKELEPAEVNKNLLELLIEEKNVIASVAINELMRLAKNQFVFTMPVKSEKLLDVYRENLNSVGNFVNGYCTISAIDKSFLRDLYREYQAFAEDNGLHVMEKPTFKMNISSLEQVTFKKKIRIGDRTGAGFVGIHIKTTDEYQDQGDAEK